MSDSLFFLSEFLKSEKEKRQEEISQIDATLPRGQYLNQKKKILDKKKYREIPNFYSPSNDQVISRVEDSLGEKIPTELISFYKICSWYCGEHTTGVTIDSVESLPKVKLNKSILVDRDELFPVVYLVPLEFGSWGKMPISVWKNKETGVYDGKVFVHDLVDRVFYVVANSIENFIARLVHGIVNQLKIDLLEPTDIELRFIHNLESGAVYPVVDKAGTTKFSFDDLNSFLPEWQVFLADKDKKFKL